MIKIKSVVLFAAMMFGACAVDPAAPQTDEDERSAQAPDDLAKAPESSTPVAEQITHECWQYGADIDTSVCGAFHDHADVHDQIDILHPGEYTCSGCSGDCWVQVRHHASGKQGWIRYNSLGNC